MLAGGTIGNTSFVAIPADLSAHTDQAGAERAVPEGILSIVRRMVLARMAAVRLKYAMKVLVNLINGLGPIGILMVGGWFVIEGRTELGTVVAFLSGFEKVIGPGRELMTFYRQVSDARMRYGMPVGSFPRMPEGAPPLPEPHPV